MKLLEHLPSFYNSSDYIRSLINSEDLEVGLLEDTLKDIFDNLYVDTATWGLAYFERELGIKVELDKPLEERREAIKSKKTGRGTTTKDMIRNTAKVFTESDIEIIEQAHLYHFIIKFVDTKGTPKNIEDFKSMLDEIKPAHLTWELQFLYNVWNYLKNKTWGSVSEDTWESIKVKE